MEKQFIALEKLSYKRKKIVTILTIIIGTVYSSFLGIIAFAKKTASIIVAEGLSLVIILGFATILSVWVVTLIYVYWANTYYDKILDRIRTISTKKG